MRLAHTKLVTSSQMARIDKRAIAGGIPGKDLMEAAGCGVTRVVTSLLGDLQNKNLILLCGKGNNGGDGFVVARLASSAGASPQVFLAAPEDEITGDALFHLDKARDWGIRISEVRERADLKQVEQAVSSGHVIVDALLGTGIRGGAKGLTADLIEMLNRAACPIVAVDVPSGLSADTGRAEGACTRATCTVTFGLPKIGQFFHPGRGLSGRLNLVDIGLEPSAVEAEDVKTYLLENRLASGLLPARKPDAHKGDCGRVVIVGGSVGLTGAPTLSAMAALKSGAGLVTVGAPESLNDILEVKLTEAMTRPLPEVRRTRCLALRARGEIKRLLEGADALALGPGLGTHRETIELVKRLIPNVEIPIVLDADGLNALAGDPGHLKTLTSPAVITPHPGEFSRLTGTEVSKVLVDPIEAASSLAQSTGVTVVLKGAPTVVATPDGKSFVNSSGNAGMASGGSGDVLTGVIAALLGQGLVPEEATCLGVYLHGLAGDLGAEKIGEAGLVARDIVESLPRAEQQIRSGNDSGRYIQYVSN